MKKGGKLQAKIVKDFLNASYQKNPPAELDGFTLDRDLSSDTAKVYYNPNSNHAVVVHRGTQGLKDWGNNLAYAVGAYEKTKRFKQGKSVQQRAEAKYGKENISTLGHSQGAVLARKLGKQSKEIINVNPAYTFEKPHSNEFNVRSSSDVVSGLYAPVATARKVLYPQFSKHHDITIPSERPTDIIKEHSPNILDRMGDSVIGHGRKYTPIYIPMRRVGGRRSSDINWYGGALSDYNSAPSDDTNLDVAHAIGTGETPQFDFNFNPEVYTMNDAPYNLGEGHMPQTNYLGGERDEESSSEEEMEGGYRHREEGEPSLEDFEKVEEIIHDNEVILNVLQNSPERVTKKKLNKVRSIVRYQYNLMNRLAQREAAKGSRYSQLVDRALGLLYNNTFAITNFKLEPRLEEEAPEPKRPTRGGARRRRRDVEDTRELIKELLDRIKYLDDNINTLHAEIQHNRHLLHHPTTSEEEAIELQEQIERDKEELIRDTQEKEEKQEFLFKLKENETEFKGEGRKKACWKGYEQYGMKTKKGRQVPNCIPIKKGGKAPKIDFEEVKWGTFKNLLQRYNKEHPQAPLKDLHQLASLIIKHPENFSKVAHKKALFYKNIIEKK